MSDSTPSAWIYFPTKEEPSRKYKYTSLEIKMSLDQKNWTRETYSLLHWLGDLGGLLDAMRYIAHVLVLPFANYALKTSLLSSFFRLLKKETVS